MTNGPYMLHIALNFDPNMHDRAWENDKYKGQSQVHGRQYASKLGYWGTACGRVINGWFRFYTSNGDKVLENDCHRACKQCAVAQELLRDVRRRS